MRNPFKKAPRSEPVYAPARGRLIVLDDVPDPVFASRSMGEGFALLPEDGTFRSPVSGELVLLADTLHAFAIRTPAGAEVLIHIGVDTVTLKGQGFVAERRLGDQVSAGDVVITCDLSSIGNRVPSMATPVIVMNGDQFTISPPGLNAPSGQPVATIVPAGN